MLSVSHNTPCEIYLFEMSLYWYALLSILSIIVSFISGFPGYSHHKHHINAKSCTDDQVVMLNMFDPLAAAYECTTNANLDVNKYLISGALAGGCRALSRGLTFPLDTMKTRNQAESYVVHSNNSNQNPIRGYFRGIGPAVISAVPANALFFLVYKSLAVTSYCLDDNFRQTWATGLSEDLPPLQLVDDICISILATFPQNMIKIPFEIVKQRAQLNPSESSMQIFTSVLSTEGVGGLYVGGGAQLLREISYNVFQMTTFNYLKSSYSHNVNLDFFDDAVKAGIFGLFAAAFAALVTQPADVVKTRLMTGNTDTNHHLPSVSGDYSRISRGGGRLRSVLYRIPVLRVAGEIVRTEGWGGLMAGLTPRLTLVAIGGTFYFWAAEYAEQMLDTSLKLK